MPRCIGTCFGFYKQLLHIYALVVDFFANAGGKKTKAFAYRIYSHFTQQCMKTPNNGDQPQKMSSTYLYHFQCYSTICVSKAYLKAKIRPSNGHCAQKKAYFCFIRRQVKHKTVDNFGTNRDISMKFFVVDPHNYGVE